MYMGNENYLKTDAPEVWSKFWEGVGLDWEG
jgi:hypothetical protein